MHVLRANDQQFVAKFRSGKDGRFRLALKPGRYLLDPRETRSVASYTGYQRVRVRPCHYTKVVIHYDSGQLD